MKSHLLHVLLCEHLLLTGCRVRGLLGGGHLHPAHTDYTLDVCHSRLIGWPEHQNPHPCYVQCFLLFIVLCLTVGNGLDCSGSVCCCLHPGSHLSSHCTTACYLPWPAGAGIANLSWGTCSAGLLYVIQVWRCKLQRQPEMQNYQRFSGMTLG